MKNGTKVQNEITDDHKMIEGTEKSEVTIPSYDKEIVR